MRSLAFNLHFVHSNDYEWINEKQEYSGKLIFSIMCL